MQQPATLFPFPVPANTPSGDLASGLLRNQMNMAGGLMRWSSESAGFLTGRVQKDAEMLAGLASVRSPTDAATLMMRHMQSAWADYSAHAMKLAAMMTEASDNPMESATSATPAPTPDTAQEAPQPRGQSASAKSTRSDPV
jgi:hypothetical protein